ncbi:UDP-N-acetylmuramoyl-tripeptide--D-alanyl-D-alanine ligase [Niveibacterium sp. SC-1]|uniref:UDP-N-acetylmuramoyl-tripeptide--D-alanyl-D- alanine ligase n=1 Tax=Niveibacterium sp. SC-1 TaxID=3135646 RepID=UPI00311E42B6
MRTELAELALGIGAVLHGADATVAGVSTDSRGIAAGQLFVALRGERFDGHEFVAAVASAGAAGAVVDASFELPAQLPLSLLVVDDTRLALGRMAAWWRAKFDLPLIGVTGSNGKTTVKEMCAAILRAQFGDAGVLATVGNLNNDIGMPQMLLRLNLDHRAAVIEMGMNHPGEIGYLTQIARPTVALVNNAQRAHLEGMGGLDAVALEKGEIYAGLGKDGVAVINADDAHATTWRDMNTQRSVLEFGLGAADVQAQFVVSGLGSEVTLRAPQGECRFLLKVPGAHNVRNAAAAAAACLAAGVPLAAVEEGLSQYVGTKGRLQIRAGENGSTVLDDSYNANPDSMRAGVDVLAMTPGRKLFVFGDMGEIGDRAAQYHDEIGGYAKSQGVDMLFALGEHAEVAARNFGEGSAHFDSVEALVQALRRELAPGVVVLVKGSRFMKMERVADAIALKD